MTIVLGHSPNSLLTCYTSPRMVILSIPRLVVLECSYPFTRGIGPGLSPYTVGTQGKIGPHKQVGLGLKDHDTIIKWVGLGLSHLVEYPYLDTTRTRHANPN